MSVHLINAHSLHMPLPDESMHCCVTSPPYWGLRDYGLPSLVWGGDPECLHVWGGLGPEHHPGQVSQTKWSNNTAISDGQTAGSDQFCQRCRAWRGCLGLEPSIELYVSHLVQVFREVRRVLHPTGTLWLNLGDSYARQAGDNATRGTPNTGQANPERMAHEKKGLNKPPSGLKPKDLCMIPARVALALQQDGWWLRSQIIWHKPNCMPESVTDRPTTSHEYVFLLAKSERYFYDQEAIREHHLPQTIRRWQNGGEDTLNTKFNKLDPQTTVGNLRNGSNPIHPNGRNRRTVWTIPTHPYPDSHFATFPPALIEPMIKAGTSEYGVCPECLAPWERIVDVEYSDWIDGNSNGKRKGEIPPERKAFASGKRCNKSVSTTGWQPTCNHAHNPIPATVFDPFVGSGTTLQIARALGRHGIGLDLSYAYLHDQARSRLELDDWDAWHNGVDGNGAGSLEGLPLFEGLG